MKSGSYVYFTSKAGYLYRAAVSSDGQLGTPEALKLDGMITGKDTLEMAVFMTIGQENLRVNLKLKYIGSRWMCIYADFG